MSSLEFNVLPINDQTGSFSSTVLSQVSQLIVDAGNVWGRYLDAAAGASIEISVDIIEFPGTALASGGTTLINGQAVSLTEVNTGFDANFDDPDISLTIDASSLNQSFFETDVRSREAQIPVGQFDLFSILTHELLHGLGVLSGVPTFNDNVVKIDGDPFFNGQNVVDILGEVAPLAPGNESHLGNRSGSGLADILDDFSLISESLAPGVRNTVTPLEVAVLQDIGINVRTTTDGDDILYGFDQIDFSDFDINGVFPLFPESRVASLPQSIIDITDGVDVLVGAGGDDQLFGLSGNDILIGGTGNDTTIGGLGDDTHIVNSQNDVVVELTGQGSNDRVAASVSFTLAADDDIELLTTTSLGGAAEITLTGNGLAQTITGNAGDNTLIGLGGNDTLNGFTGDDILIGGTGNDTTIGGLGDDTHIVNSQDDIVVENAGEGTNDRVASNTSFTLAADDDIELLTTTALAGTTAINLSGNELAQTIIGNAGNNVLDGGAGNDLLIALGGSDVFLFDEGHDQDIVRGFQDNIDEIDLSAFNFTNAADALSNATQVDNDVIFDFGYGDTLTVEDVLIVELGNDLIF